MREIKEDLGHIKEVVIRMETDLKYHIKRTDLLEEKFKPVEDHVKFIRQLMKSATWAAGLTAASLSVIKFLMG